MTRRLKLIIGLSMGLLVLWAALFPITLRILPGADTVAPKTAIGGPFTLIDTGGRTVTDQTYRGEWMLVYFGYTLCPDACPTALNNLSAALAKMGAAAAAVRPVFITIDPKRDTVPVMAEYLKSFDPRIVGLTGGEAQIESVVKAYRVYVARQKGDADDDYIVDHSIYLYLVDPHGRFVNVLGSDLSGDQIAVRLRNMMARSGV